MDRDTERCTDAQDAAGGQQYNPSRADAELKIWVAGHGEPIKKEFRKGVDIYEVQGMLAQHIAP